MTTFATGGIYDPPEAARYLRVGSLWAGEYALDSTTLIRWIRRGLASPELKHVRGRELLLEFNDLISMRVVIALRASGVSWREIRHTEAWLREQTGLSHPLATEDLWTGQGELFVDWTRRLISGSRNGQVAFALLQEYLIPVHGLRFSTETHIASSWEPRAGVLLEPRIQFGAPCIKGTRIPTRTVAGMVEAGDSPDWVAIGFGITTAEVEAACEWESRLAAS